MYGPQRVLATNHQKRYTPNNIDNHEDFFFHLLLDVLDPGLLAIGPCLGEAPLCAESPEAGEEQESPDASVGVAPVEDVLLRAGGGAGPQPR